MDAALEILISKRSRLLLEHQDKVRYLINGDLPDRNAKKGIQDNSLKDNNNQDNEVTDRLTSYSPN